MMTDINKQISYPSSNPAVIREENLDSEAMSNKHKLDWAPESNSDNSWFSSVNEPQASPSVSDVYEDELSIIGNLKSEAVCKHLARIEQKMLTLQNADQASSEVESAHQVVSQILWRMRLVQQAKDGLIVG